MVYDERGNNIISFRRAGKEERVEREDDDGLVPAGSIELCVWLCVVCGSPSFSRRPFQNYG